MASSIPPPPTTPRQSAPTLEQLGISTEEFGSRKLEMLNFLSAQGTYAQDPSEEGESGQVQIKRSSSRSPAPDASNGANELVSVVKDEPSDGAVPQESEGDRTEPAVESNDGVGHRPTNGDATMRTRSPPRASTQSPSRPAADLHPIRRVPESETVTPRPVKFLSPDKATGSRFPQVR